MTVPFAPAAVRALGEKRGMVVGAIGYCVFLASLVRVSRPVVLAASVVIGAGAALLWVAQGSFLIRSSAGGNRERYAGLFWGLFQWCNVVGNLSAYFVFSHASRSTLFACFFGTAVLGLLVLMAVRPLPPLAGGAEDAGDAPSPLEMVVAAARLFRRRAILLMLPVFFLTGLELAFWTGEFTRLLDADVIGLVLAFAGAGEIVAGAAVSAAGARAGRSATMLAGSASYAGGLVLASALQRGAVTGPSWRGAPWAAYVAAFAFGVGDCVFNTAVYGLLGSKVAGADAVGAFTVYQLLQNAGSAAGYYSSPLVPLHGSDGTPAQLWVQGAAVAAALAGVVLADRTEPDAPAAVEEEKDHHEAAAAPPP